MRLDKLALTTLKRDPSVMWDLGTVIKPPAKKAPHIPKVPYDMIEWLAWLKSARSIPEVGKKLNFKMWILLNYISNTE